MAFTDNGDVFVSVNEAGINRVLGHARIPWPSLSNDAAAAVEQRRKLRCGPIDALPVVTDRNNPLITIEPPIAIVARCTGSTSKCVTKATVDVTRGNCWCCRRSSACSPHPGSRLTHSLRVVASPPNDIEDRLPVTPVPETTYDDRQAQGKG
jgi:hypothetical protein